MKAVFLRSDHRFSFGSKEHYFHYVMGYAAPAISYLVEKKLLGAKVYFESCGEVMDPRTHDFGELFHLDYEIVGPLDSAPKAVDVVITPWDVILHKPVAVLYTLLRKNHATKLFRKWTRYSDFMRESSVEVLMHSTVRSMRKLKKAVMNQLTAEDELLGKKYEGKYLILKRPAQHQYYTDRGETAGAGRKNLVGLEEVQAQMTRDGVPAVIFESGEMSLVEQVCAYGACRGVIGMVGAEFGNMLWMNSKQRVIILLPVGRTVEKQILRKQADALNIDWSIVWVPSEKYHKLCYDELAPVL